MRDPSAIVLGGDWPKLTQACSATAGCRWVEPGCGDSPAPENGCFPECEDAACTGGATCTVVSHDPCFSADPYEPCSCEEESVDVAVCL